MLLYRIFISDVAPPVLSMLFLIALYNREEAGFGEFSVFLVLISVFSGFFTGFQDAEVIRGRKLWAKKIIHRLCLSAFLLTLSIILTEVTSYSYLSLIFMIISAASSLSALELIHAMLINKNKFYMFTSSRLTFSCLLITLIPLTSTANPYFAYILTTFLSLVFSSALCYLSGDLRLQSLKISTSVYARLKKDLSERLLSTSLRFVGSSPVLIAASAVGTELAAFVLLAQRVLGPPIGLMLNLIFLPKMLECNENLTNINSSLVYHSLCILCLSLFGFFAGAFLESDLTPLGLAVFFLVGVCLYYERLIYSLFHVTRETKLWITFLFFSDSLIFIYFSNLPVTAHMPSSWTIFATLFFPKVALSAATIIYFRTNSIKGIR